MKKQAFGKKLFLHRETLTVLNLERASGGSRPSMEGNCTANGTCTTLTSNNSNCSYGSDTNTQPLCN